MTRHRRKYLNRGTTPLYWADASYLIQRIYQAARKSVPWNHSASPDRALSIQPWLQRVSVEFQRRLHEERIYVED